MKGRYFDVDIVYWFCRLGWGGCVIVCVWIGYYRGGGVGWGCFLVLLFYYGFLGLVIV